MRHPEEQRTEPVFSRLPRGRQATHPRRNKFQRKSDLVFGVPGVTLPLNLYLILPGMCSLACLSQCKLENMYSVPCTPHMSLLNSVGRGCELKREEVVEAMSQQC